jgi:hypothetical protein
MDLHSAIHSERLIYFNYSYNIKIKNWKKKTNEEK